MTRRVVFVTQNYDTVHRGGAGAFIGELSRALAAGGCDVSVVFGDAGAEYTEVGGVTVRAVPFPDPDGSFSWFIDRSRALAEAVSAVVASGEPVDLVEFTDFESTALWALLHRHQLGLETTRLGVRLHGPVDAITAAMGAAPAPLDRVAQSERLALSMADVVLVPSAAVGAWAVDRYGVEEDRLVVAPPPVVGVEPVEWTPGSEPVFVAFGRLTEQKGPHDLVRAMEPVFEAIPGTRLRFIGPDGWSASQNRPMSEVVLSMVAPEHRERVEFAGAMPRQQALESMATAWAMVVASRYESFCLAAHEARRAGLPVIAPDMPPFEAYRSGYGIRLYDGSIDDLAATLGAVAADRGVVETLAAEPPPPVGDPVAGYLGALPQPRHPHSQAGLATVASQALAVLAAPPPSRLSRAARRLLRLLPGPVARLAVRVAPRRLKDRFRTLASWPQEQARRAADERRRRVRDAALGGAFPPVDDPEVSVVIPCFEQGEWVVDAVVSVFEQTLDRWEIVLVDDGSTDPITVSRLDDLATWPRVRLIRQENRGLAAARNAGMAQARGRFVVPLDADDEITPRFMETLATRLDEEPKAAFAHCWAELFGDVEGIWATRPVNPYWDLWANSVVGCVMLRREAWEAAGGYDETMRDGNEDWELWVRLRGAGWGQVRVMEPLFRYRKHGVSMSVMTEASFERGWSQVAQRSPDLYDPAAVRDMKHRLYPLISVIDDDSAGLFDDDVQVVVETDTAAAVRAAAGKYVADRRGASWPIEAAVALAERLEDAADRAWAHDPDTGAAVWRRWALLDPGCGLEDGLGPPPPGVLAAGAFPDPEWMVPADAVPAGRRIVRQRPEEAGRVPDRIRR